MRLIASTLCAALLGASVCYGQEKAHHADAFVDSIGVNTHLGYTGTQYRDQWEQTFAALKTLGVRHIRDNYFYFEPSYPLYARHQQLAAAGIKCNYIIPYNTQGVVANIPRFASLVGDMESVESPNEYDDNGGGGDWQSRLLSYLPTVVAAGAAANVPVLGPSLIKMQDYASLGDISSQMTYNNLHIYFGGRNPENPGWGSTDKLGHKYGTWGFWWDSAEMDGPGLRKIVTETGYLTHPSVNGAYTIPDDIEAAYLTRSFLTAFSYGFMRTYAYELIDEPVHSQGFGLLNQDMSPKPAFTALSNLIGLLSDRTPYFWGTGSLTYTVTGSTQQVEHLLMQKHDGSYWLALWVGAQDYDEVNQSYIDVPPQTVQLTLQGSPQLAVLHSFQNDGSVVDTQLGGRSAPLTLGRNISLVEIR